MRVSTENDDPGYLAEAGDSVFFTVFFDGVEQGLNKTGRVIITADEEEGLIRFNGNEEGNLHHMELNAAHDGFHIFELRGRVEIKHKDGEMPMELRGFGT